MSLTVDIDVDGTRSGGSEGVGGDAGVRVDVASIDGADGEHRAPPHLSTRSRLPHPEVRGRGVRVRCARQDHRVRVLQQRLRGGRDHRDVRWD